MVTYWVKTPDWFKKFFPKGMIWDIPATKDPAIYITFDDGPHPTITPFVLEQLNKYNAKATFFCVGNNVVKYPDVSERTVAEGHTLGNHTYDHMNGWHTSNSVYVKNIIKAKVHINSKLFRPPYGRIRFTQVRKLLKSHTGWRIYMWDILSGDFDKSITPEQCLESVLTNIRPGSIVVFHDSEKAWDRMQYALPRVLDHCRQQGWEMKALPQ